METDPDQETERNVTGWIVDKGVITAATPDGDKIIFGEAVDSEAEASRRGGRKGAAQDAMRLYARLAEYFPTSPLAAEAAYRSADIRWQIEAIDAATRPSVEIERSFAEIPDRRAVHEESDQEISGHEVGVIWRRTGCSITRLAAIGRLRRSVRRWKPRFT